MLQQTPVARVAAGLARVAGPLARRRPALAAAAPGEAVRALGPARLPAPGPAPARRGRWRSPQRHGGQVPAAYADLLALPGVGSYTAAAVASFAFGRPPGGRGHQRPPGAGPAGSRPGAAGAGAHRGRDARWPRRCCPPEPAAAARWNVAVMELGALVCTARAPRCGALPRGRPVRLAAGRRAGVRRSAPPRPGLGGTDRQCRGALLAVLRAASHPVARAALASAWLPDDGQRERCLDSLVADGLVEPLPRGRFRLPQSEPPAPASPSRQDGQHAAESPG